MTSANGYSINQNGFNIVATWAAPFFVLVLGFDPEEKPMLIHCDDLSNAQRHAAIGGILLDSKFERVQ